MNVGNRRSVGRRDRWGRIAGIVFLVSAAALQTAHLRYPTASEVSRGDLGIVVEDYVAAPVPAGLSGYLSRLSTLRFEPGSAPHFSTRAFVGDLQRHLYILDLSTKTFTPYINFEEVFPKFVNRTSFGTGFATFALDPGYEGNGRFYTVHTEGPSRPGPATPSNANLPGLDLSAGYLTTTSVDPPVGTVSRHSVLVEWTDTDLSNAVFEGTAREVLRLGFNRGNHSVADMLFNPTAYPGDADYGNLYISVGDGGAGQDNDEGHSIPQRLDAMPGKLLRITPDVDLRPEDVLASNSRYRIPSTGPDPNPFGMLPDPAVKKEIFAYGFRNPQRMSWDPVSGLLIVADIGLHAWEEINIIRKGANYGYAEREGSEQLFVGGPHDGATGSQTTPLTTFPDPDTLTVAGIDAPVVPTYPVAAFSHRDGDAISGGFVYRGTRIPQLYGKYIFGDISTARIFYVEVADMLAAEDGDSATLAAIRELNVLFDRPDDSPDRGAVATRLFDVIATQFANRGGLTGDGAALPDGGGHLSDGVDPDGIPFGGGRADIRFAVDRDGELYILSKSDGMVRAIVGARSGGTTTVLSLSPNPSESGEEVELTAIVTPPAAGSGGVVEFSAGQVWLGTGAVSEGMASFKTSALPAGSHLLVARFVPGAADVIGSASARQHFVSASQSYALSVSLAGTGAGTVTSSPSGMTCPSVCTASFDTGAPVTLTAAPDNASQFVGWTGACAGATSCTITLSAAATVTATFAPGEPDLISLVSAVPPTAAPGAKLAVSETTANEGSAGAGTSTTRYFLSADALRGPGDIALGSRSIATLAADARSSATASLTVPSNTLLGSYFVLACADNSLRVAERDEQNNCGASAAAMTVTRPDLVQIAVGSPPPSIAPGGIFTVDDTVVNRGGHPSVSSTTRYYLSADATKSAGDMLLSGSRSVPALAPDAISAGTSKNLTVTASTPLGVYYLIACSDGTARVAELSESNNCTASAADVRVGLPDLLVSSVSNPPAEIAPGKKFSVTTATVNQGTAPSKASTTRFYLSADGTKDAFDVLLSSTASVAALTTGQTTSATRALTVSTTMPAGTYRLLACADDIAAVRESDEANNCSPAAASMQVKVPDLAPTAVSGPQADVSPGGTLAVTHSRYHISTINER